MSTNSFNAENFTVYGFDATYSAEDNKLRLYTESFLEREDYDFLTKKMGFKNAPKQKLFFASWSPNREDFCLLLAETIEAEETTLAERALAKAERLEGYRDNRIKDAESYSDLAHDIAKRFEFGQPILVGHHSERKARKDKERMEGAMSKSVKNAQMVDYWSWRVDGVISHANQKANPRTRLNRIKGLYEDLREYQRALNHCHILFSLWSKINDCSDKEEQFKLVEHYMGVQIDTGYATPINSISLAENNQQEIIDQCLRVSQNGINNLNRKRCIIHTLNRIAYENSQLGEVAQFKQPITKTIIQAFFRHFGAHKPEAVKKGDNWIITSDVDFPDVLAEGKELTISSENLSFLMKNVGYRVPVAKARRTTTKKTVSLINPTLEQAKSLQDLWNNNERNKNPNHAKTIEVMEITQQHYSNNSKGDYSAFETVEIDQHGNEVYMSWKGGDRIKNAEPVARIRVKKGNGFYMAASVLHITDKPAKTLPIDIKMTEEA